MGEKPGGEVKRNPKKIGSFGKIQTDEVTPIFWKRVDRPGCSPMSVEHSSGIVLTSPGSSIRSL